MISKAWATCYTSRETLQLLHETFSGRVISGFGDQYWLLRSCDLTSLNFLWGYLNHRSIATSRQLLVLQMKDIQYCNNEIQFIQNYFGRPWGRIPLNGGGARPWETRKLYNDYIFCSFGLFVLLSINVKCCIIRFRGFYEISITFWYILGGLSAVS